jgi:hypothetical protein
LKIVYHTHHYPEEKFQKYIKKAISFVPDKDLKGINRINVYDFCPTHFPHSVKGGYYPATKKMGAIIDLYLDQNLGHMHSFHRKINYITKLYDKIFIKLFGKIFIIHTLLHEIGHFVDDTNDKKKKNKSKEEDFANDYANKILNRIYPLNNKFFTAFNSIYRNIYKKRIEHDNKAGNNWKSLNKKRPNNPLKHDARARRF